MPKGNKAGLAEVFGLLLPHLDERRQRLALGATARVVPPVWIEVLSEAPDRLCLPAVDDRAVRGLRFGDALPPRLAEATLSARLADLESAATVLAEPVRFVAVSV